MNRLRLARRSMLGGTAMATAFGLSRARAQTAAPTLPSTPIELNVLDVGGALQLCRPAFDAYAKAHPNLVSRISYTQAPAPELAGKLMAQQAAGRAVDIHIVLTGTDAIADGIEQKLWLPLVPDHQASLSNFTQDAFLPGAWKMQELALGQGICFAYSPAGPLLEFMPGVVKNPPRSAEELLEWTRQHPKRYFYGRPNGSFPGRNLMQALPYLLGDPDPKDPKTWDKTWSYLEELGKNIEYYPTGTAVMMRELADGSRDMISSTVGWDFNPRALGVVPKEAQVTTLKGFRWITDGEYMAIPKGVDAPHLAVALDFINTMLTKPAQAVVYDSGYFYPGPSIKDVPLTLASEKTQALFKEFSRPEIDQLIATVPTETQLAAGPMHYMLERWDRQIGAKAGSK